VTICFEIAYPHLSRWQVRDGATFLLNLSNEAWFPETAEFEQYAAMAFRAVETRRSPVRSRTAARAAGSTYGERHLFTNGKDGRREGFPARRSRPTCCDETTLYVRTGEAMAAAASPRWRCSWSAGGRRPKEGVARLPERASHRLIRGRARPVKVRLLDLAPPLYAVVASARPRGRPETEPQRRGAPTIPRLPWPRSTLRYVASGRTCLDEARIVPRGRLPVGRPGPVDRRSNDQNPSSHERNSSDEHDVEGLRRPQFVLALFLVGSMASILSNGEDRRKKRTVAEEKSKADSWPLREACRSTG
jgi:hypothetical protein